MLSTKEINTVLAALRFFQMKGAAAGPEIADLATNNGAESPMSNDEIDALCERLNVSEPLNIVVHMEGGAVQSVMANRETGDAVVVFTLDYDTDGIEQSELVSVTQDDGSTVMANVTNWGAPERAGIVLTDVTG